MSKRIRTESQFVGARRRLSVRKAFYSLLNLSNLQNKSLLTTASAVSSGVRWIANLFSILNFIKKFSN